MKAKLLLIIGLAISIGCGGIPEKSGEPARSADRLAKSPEVVAYYFHRTTRCETCIKIEKLSQSMIESRFSDELGSGQLAFKAVNYDEPENVHFSKDFDLSSPSLVLVRTQDGKPKRWKTLQEVWSLVEIPPKLDQYIERETRKFLDSAE